MVSFQPAYQFRRVWLMTLVSLATLIAGCETDSWMDPSTLGRWEPTPVKLPILKRLHVMDEPATGPMNLTSVLREDLIPEVREYVIGVGDAVAISVFELVRPGTEYAIQRTITDLGIFRHPRLGNLQVSGFTEGSLEEEVGRIVKEQGLLKDPEVNVSVLNRRQRTYSFIGGVGGTYGIYKADMRMLDALASVGQLPSSIRTIYVIRKAELQNTDIKIIDQIKVHTRAEDPIGVLEPLLNSDDDDATDVSSSPRQAAPQVLQRTLDSNDTNTNWVYIDGKWVLLPTVPGHDSNPAEVLAQALFESEEQDSASESVEGMSSLTQRVIEVPYHLLRIGDWRYNLVIRPGDVIYIPLSSSGRIYMTGSIARPGTYTVPGEQSLTFIQAVAAAGGVVGVPERVDLTRRINSDHAVTIRLNARSIFEGREPDFFIKPDDIVNVGTNALMIPLSVVRRGFRGNYGFGFVLDRNFANDVF